MLQNLSEKLKNKTSKYIYKERIGQKRIVHIGKFKITYKRKSSPASLPKEDHKLPFFGEEAIYKMLNEYTFDTVLDIGCGKDYILKYLKNIKSMLYH